jgi:hypothetical protein
MSVSKIFIGVVCAVLATAPPLFAAEPERGTIFTLWPLIDYRSSPAEGFRNLSILGPLIKFQTKGADSETAVRPFFFESQNSKHGTVSTDFLYPAASKETTPEAFNYEVFRLYQKTIYRKDEPKRRQEGVTFFPFYITGTSEKYGPYRSIFPFYGDMYQRFWRDEYHIALFPLYGRTVKNGTSTSHYLYPFFSRTKGDKEAGFEVFPLYGQSEKEGVYRKRYLLWPFWNTSETGLDTANPTSKTTLFPLYASSDSPLRSSRNYFWPFFGYSEDREKKSRQVDYFWPLIYTERGEKRNVTSLLPIYAHETSPEAEKSWYFWPLYRHSELHSPIFEEKQDRVLFFLYRDRLERWPKDGAERRRLAVWPLFLYKTTPHGVSSLSVPAPVEPVLDKEGIEHNWAPYWRLYQRRWNDNGDSASSLLWNLFWHERRGDDLAYELFPLVSYRSEKGDTGLRLFKGLVGYNTCGNEKELTLLWLPVGLKWGGK